MARNKGKRTRIIVVAVLIVFLVAIGTVALIKAIAPGKQDPYVSSNTSSTQSDTSSNATENKDATNSQPSDTSTPSSQSKDASEDAVPDPSTVATIDIEPLALTVSYVKGAGGFEYEVLRTPNGTRYVEFRAASLVGTKCTDDQGAFASILVSPNADESAAVAKTVTLGDTKYGLSLASSTCTSDTAKLDTYQKSFSDAFSLLKKME